jgi:lipopolysaccharide biosynthesis regulator YciM
MRKLIRPVDVQARLHEALDKTADATPAQRREMQKLVFEVCSRMQKNFFLAMLLDEDILCSPENIRRLSEEAKLDLMEIWKAFENYFDAISRPQPAGRNPNSPWKA